MNLRNPPETPAHLEMVQESRRPQKNRAASALSPEIPRLRRSFRSVPQRIPCGSETMQTASEGSQSGSPRRKSRSLQFWRSCASFDARAAAHIAHRADCRRNGRILPDQKSLFRIVDNTSLHQSSGIVISFPKYHDCRSNSRLRRGCNDKTRDGSGRPGFCEMGCNRIRSAPRQQKRCGWQSSHCRNPRCLR